MSEQTTGRTRPEIKGKVLAILPEWRNSSGTFWKREVVVETGLRYPNPLKVAFQKEATSHVEGLAEGDCVIIPYLLNGREYDGRYYVDIVGMGVQKIVGASQAAKSATAGASESGASATEKPILGCSAETAIEAWTAKHGDDKAGFAEFCKGLKPDKASKAYTISDWADVVNAINGASAATADGGAGDPDDIGF